MGNLTLTLRSLGMKKEWAQDRVEWRRLIGGGRSIASNPRKLGNKDAKLETMIFN